MFYISISDIDGKREKMSYLRRRSRVEVIEQILKEARKETPPTRLMYLNNLSFATFNRYIKYLLDKGLIAPTQGDRVLYKTTKKGEEFLELTKKLRKYIDLL